LYHRSATARRKVPAEARDNDRTERSDCFITRTKNQLSLMYPCHTCTCRSRFRWRHTIGCCSKNHFLHPL